MRGIGRLKSSAPATAVQRFCNGVTWADFRCAEASDARSRGTTSTGVGGPSSGDRPSAPSALSAFDLYRQLLPKSLPPKKGSLDRDTIFEVDRTTSSEHQYRQHDENHTDEPDTDMLACDRQVIFINNLDPMSVWALIGTTPSHQVGFLRHTLESHLCRTTSIAVEFAYRGLESFTMAFDLSHISLTKSEAFASETLKPTRKTVIQKDLDASFMDWRSNQSVILHRSHISCTFHGHDLTRYKVLCLVSSCGDASAETVEHYIRSEAAQHNDPCVSQNEGSMTTEVADFPNEPREYWLSVLNERLGIAVDDWKAVRRFLQDSVEAADIVRLELPSQSSSTLR